MSDELLEALQTEVDPVMNVSPEWGESLKHALGGTLNVVASVIDGLVAMATTQLASKMAQYIAASYENWTAITWLRVQTSQAEKLLQEVDNYRKTLDQYMKYFDILPSLKYRITQAFDAIDTIIAGARSLVEDAKRLSYANDYLNSAITEISSTITDLISLRNWINKLTQ